MLGVGHMAQLVELDFSSGSKVRPCATELWDAEPAALGTFSGSFEKGCYLRKTRVISVSQKRQY